MAIPRSENIDTTACITIIITAISVVNEIFEVQILYEKSQTVR